MANNSINTSNHIITKLEEHSKSKDKLDVSQTDLLQMRPKYPSMSSFDYGELTTNMGSIPSKMTIGQLLESILDESTNKVVDSNPTKSGSQPKDI